MDATFADQLENRVGTRGLLVHVRYAHVPVLVAAVQQLSLKWRNWGNVEDVVVAAKHFFFGVHVHAAVVALVDAKLDGVGVEQVADVFFVDLDVGAAEDELAIGIVRHVVEDVFRGQVDEAWAAVLAVHRVGFAGRGLTVGEDRAWIQMIDLKCTIHSMHERIDDSFSYTFIHHSSGRIRTEHTI